MNSYNFFGDGGFWMISKPLAKLAGIEAAILLSDILSKRQYFLENKKITLFDWFYNTIEDVENDTTLTKHAQLKAVKMLQSLGFISVKYQGLPKKRYFIINDKNIIETLSESQSSKILTTRRSKFERLDVENFNINNNKVNNNKIIKTNKKEKNKNKKEKSALSDLVFCVMSGNKPKQQKVFTKY